MNQQFSGNQMELYAYRAMCYADDHVADNFEMKDVAEWLGISYSYFYHIFAEVMGEPYWQYVKRHRLELSAGLLRHSGYNISEIGERSGYATVAAFTKAFTQQFGKSPRSFRRITELPNEKRTLVITEAIVQAHARSGNLIMPYFSFERAEYVQLQDSLLYYTLLSRGQDPIAQMIFRMGREEARLRGLLNGLELPQARVITSTLDAVPVTDYERLSMYLGIMTPVKDISPQLARAAAAANLLEKRLPGGHYLRLRLPMDFATAGIPMYEFINRYVKEGVFKMSGNHFFISLTGPNGCEIYIPHLRMW